MPEFGIKIDGLSDFVRAAKRAEATAPRQMARGIRKAGKPVQQRAAELAGAASRTGRLARSYRVRASANRGDIVSSVPYAGGADWGRFGKWKGFAQYGGFGQRFATRAIEEKADEVEDIIFEEIQDLVTMLGWAH